jgi:hypothetical protein
MCTVLAAGPFLDPIQKLTAYQHKNDRQMNVRFSNMVEAAGVEPPQDVQNNQVVDSKNGQNGKKGQERQIDCTNVVQIHALFNAACLSQIPIDHCENQYRALQANEHSRLRPHPTKRLSVGDTSHRVAVRCLSVASHGNSASLKPFFPKRLYGHVARVALSVSAAAEITGN